MDGSFANQVLAQMYLFERKFADLPEVQAKGVYVQVLPKQLDEEVARAMVEGFGGVITKMMDQAKYIGVPVEGPCCRKATGTKRNDHGIPEAIQTPLQPSFSRPRPIRARRNFKLCATNWR